MFCQNCGNKMDEGVRFCEKCGAKVGDIVPSHKETPKTVTVETPYQQPVFPPKSKSNVLGVTALVLSIIHFVVSIIAIGYMVLDGWYSGYDFIVGLIPLLITGLIFLVPGLISMMKKKSKAGKISCILIIVDIGLSLCVSVIVIWASQVGFL